MAIEEKSPSEMDGQTKTIVQQIDGQDLKSFVEAGVTWLKTNQQMINSLNVFPVPDGDTGTNMLLTMQAAYSEVSNSGERNIGRMSHAIAQGALMGARGNSGVILSQLWRGFARSMDNLDTMDADCFIKALAESRNTAYKGVVRPVEGTILTVAKDAAAAAEKAGHSTKDLLSIFEAVVEEANQSVKRTPDLLPILKSAGVVDSGGQGLFILLEGILRHIKGLSLDTPQTSVQPLSMMHLEDAMEEIEEGQDYEVVIDFKPFAPLDLENYYDHLKEIGTSIQVGEGDGIYRMHIHVPTDRRYDPIDYTLTLGAVTKVNIENLTAQIENNQKDKQTSKINLTPVKPGQIAVVVVSPGLGISHIFASLGANAIVEGGQTMNPSTEEILKAFENLPTDHIIILPNNKNIVLAAQSAASMTVKKVTVIASTSVPQGLSAMLRLVPDGNYDQVVKEMMVALTEVETGEITTASRTVEINGIKVNQGEVIALYNGNLIDSEQSLESACLGLLEKADAAAHERITLFYGSNITKNEVNQVVDKIRSTYPSHEIELHEGGQPHYQLILSIE